MKNHILQSYHAKLIITLLTVAGILKANDLSELAALENTPAYFEALQIITETNRIKLNIERLEAAQRANIETIRQQEAECAELEASIAEAKIRSAIKNEEEKRLRKEIAAQKTHIKIQQQGIKVLDEKILESEIKIETKVKALETKDKACHLEELNLQQEIAEKQAELFAKQSQRAELLAKQEQESEE